MTGEMQQGAYQTFGHRFAELGARLDAGQRAYQQPDRQCPVDMTQPGVTDARYQRQRHGMCDVGVHQPARWQARVQQQEQRGAQCAGADRAQADRHAGHPVMPTTAKASKPPATALQSITQGKPMPEFSFMLQSNMLREGATLKGLYINTNYI